MRAHEAETEALLADLSAATQTAILWRAHQTRGHALRAIVAMLEALSS
jgi:hypothetical protein